MISLSAQVARHAEQSPNTVALRVKKLGRWQQTSWAQLHEELRLVAHGLAALDIDAGDRVALIAGNRPEWLYAELGTTALRAVFTGLHPATDAAALPRILSDAAVRLLIAEDQEQVDKALTADCPLLRWIVYLEQPGLQDYSDPRLISYRALREHGRSHYAEHTGLLERIEQARTTADPVALIVPRQPDTARATELRGEHLAAALAQLRQAVPGPAPDQRDVVLPGLSLSEPAERAVTVWTCAASGAVLHFAESYATLDSDLSEVQPTLRLGSAAGWRRLRTTVETRMATATRVKRACYRLAMAAAGRGAAVRTAHGGRHTPISKALFVFGYLLCGRVLRGKLGLRATRAALWAVDMPGTALTAVPDPEVSAYFVGLGVPLGYAPAPAALDSAARPASNLDATT